MRCDRCSKETKTLVKVESENSCEECYTRKSEAYSDTGCGCFG